MHVEWDETVAALQDAAALTIEDPDSENEDRFVSIGADDLGRVLVTIFAYRDDGMRIISSRRATKKERRLY